jgi:hypothetical protein
LQEGLGIHLAGDAPGTAFFAIGADPDKLGGPGIL